MDFKSKLIVFVAVLASLLEIIDTSIVNVAIPTMMGNLGATLDDISLIVTGYAVANAIILPVSAWLSERIGRRNYFLGCIAIFTAASVACGLAPNLVTLIIFRIVQGLAGGALLPTSQALIFEQFPKEKSGIAGAIFGMSVMVGPTLGPVMGGFLTDNYGWRSIFNINLPIGMIAIFIGSLCVFDRTDQQKTTKNLDYLGFVFLALGIGCFQFLIERGNTEDWFASKAILACAIISAISIVLFIWWELRTKFPILNLKLFKEPIVISGVTLMSCLGFFLYSIVFVLPVFLTTSFNFTATQTGQLFIPGSILTALMMPFIGKSVQSISDPRILIIIGLVSVEFCLFSMTYFSTETSQTQLLNSLYIRGFALAFLFVPINSTILSQFKGFELGQVAGLLNLFRQIGGSIGIAFIDTLLTKNMKKNYNELLTHVSSVDQNSSIHFNSSMANMSHSMVKDIGLANSNDAALQILYNRVQGQVFMLSFLQLIVIMMVIFAIAFLPIFLIKLKKKVTNISDAH